ncbi:MAG: radical SAM protein [Halopenitus sp.]
MSLHISPTLQCNLGCTYSAVEGSRVLKADLQWAPIEELDIGDEVISFDNPDFKATNDNPEFEVGEITACYKYVENAIQVETEEAEVTVGETHPLLSEDNEWMATSTINPGDKIQKIDYPDTLNIELTKVKDVEPVGERILYDVTVNPEHTLVIEGLMSHNCYEEPTRDVTDVHEDYDIDAILDKLKEWRKYESETPGFHGGEPLLLPIEDLRRIYEFIDENWDGNPSIQSNGTNITDEHIELFQEFNVPVGISVDGPIELNRGREARNAGRQDITDDQSVSTMRNIVKMREAGVSVGLIVVLSEHNAGTDEKLEKLLSWMDNLNRMDVTGHFNPAIPYQDVQEDISLSPERLKEVYLRVWEWMKAEAHRQWDPHAQYIDNLLGNKLGNCVNNKCDVFNTDAAKIIKGDGETTGCGKGWSAVGDGVPFLQGDSSNNDYQESEIRYDMLKQVPEEEGGCKGCDYWNVCQGGCPSSGEDYDWRNRTLWCEAKKALYSKIEEDMRAIFPNINLITDLPWNANIADMANSRQLDIKPFVAMRPGEPGESSAYSWYRHNQGGVEDRVPDEVMPELTFDQELEQFKEKFDEDVLTWDREKWNIHADSDIR